MGLRSRSLQIQGKIFYVTAAGGVIHIDTLASKYHLLLSLLFSAIALHTLTLSVGCQERNQPDSVPAVSKDI